MCGFKVSKTKWIKEHIQTYKKNERFGIEVIFNLWLTSLNIKQSNNNPAQTFPPDNGSCPRLSQKVGYAGWRPVQTVIKKFSFSINVSSVSNLKPF